MTEEQPFVFSTSVKSFLSEEETARDLWMSIAAEFDRGGPDAAKQYLESEGQRLKNRIENLLEQVSGE